MRPIVCTTLSVSKLTSNKALSDNCCQCFHHYSYSEHQLNLPSHQPSILTTHTHILPHTNTHSHTHSHKHTLSHTQVHTDTNKLLKLTHSLTQSLTHPATYTYTITHSPSHIHPQTHTVSIFIDLLFITSIVSGPSKSSVFML